MSVRNPGGGRADPPANKPNSIVQRAFGRTIGGNVVLPCRLAFPPNPGNDLLCIYAGYQNGYSLIPPKATVLLAPNSDANNQAVYAFYSTASAGTLGANPATNTADVANAAIYELNGLKTRSATHGSGTVSGNTYTVPFPAASAGTVFLLITEWDNVAFVTSVAPSSVTVDGNFYGIELGGNHVGHALQFASTGAAGTVVLTTDTPPSTDAMFILISLAP